MKSYDEIDYARDKYDGDFPLVEILLFLEILGMIALFIWETK